jgi:hypothetical protein
MPTKESMLTDEQRQEIYRRYAQLICEPDHWLRIAQYLYAAAEQLEPKIDSLWKSKFDSSLPLSDRLALDQFEPQNYQRVYLMLIAFAVENLFKGYQVKTRKPEFLERIMRNGELPGELNKHDLRALAARCPIRLTSDEESILHRLYGHAWWIGRYPYPTKAEDYFTFTDSSPFPGAGVGWSSEEVSVTKRLVQKLAEQLEMPIQSTRHGTPT